MQDKKIVIFDFWQTLADAQLKPSFLLGFFPLPKPDLHTFLTRLSSSDLYLKDVETIKGVANFLLHFDITDKKIVEKISSAWKDLIKTVYIIPGALKMISDLKAHGHAVCLMSNTDKFGHEHFPFPEFFKKFDMFFLSYKEGFAKPDLKCWQIIRDRSGYTYDDMIMIGDSMENDILPAHELGIDSIHIQRQGDFGVVYDRLINHSDV